MIVLILRRLLLALVTFLLATLLLYAAIRQVPGTPWAGEEATPRPRIDEWIRAHHLDRGIASGYALWLGDLLRGDLGSSYVIAPGVSVAALIARDAPVSALLGTLGFAVGLILATTLGLAAARRPGGSLDRGGSIALYLLNAAPSFWIALMLQDLIAVRLGFLPLAGVQAWDTAGDGLLSRAAACSSHWILPPLCLALGSMAFLFRFARAALLDAAAGPAIRGARARGLPERLLIGRHALAGTRLQMITLVGVHAPGIIGGSIVIESVFALPGLGMLFVRAVANRDYPVVMGVGLVMAVAAITAGALMDVLYLAADPRLRETDVVRS